VASDPCDWLFLILAIKAQGASFTKTNGKVDEWKTIWPRFKKQPTCHYLVDKNNEHV
jgi:hypothetical protein